MRQNANVRPHVTVVPVLISSRDTILAAALVIGLAPLIVHSADPNGDSAIAIAEAERKLSAVDKVIMRYTFERVDASAAVPADASRSVYRATGRKGERLFFEGPADPPSGINGQQVAEELFFKGRKKFTFYDSAWIELQTIWSGLSHANQGIARAKALRYFESRPNSVAPEEWEDRLRRSQDQWHVQ